MASKASKNILAFDLGGESGRAVLGAFDDTRGTIQLTEIHRFGNRLVHVGNHLHWDVLMLWDEIGNGLRKAARTTKFESVGIDTWGVDFGLLDAKGELIGNPYAYRDPHCDGMLDVAYGLMSKQEIYAHTGMQFMQINTLYQLLAMQRTGSPALQHAKTFLMMPDLLHYWLTGVAACEFSDTTTTQFYNPRTHSWAREVLDALGIPHHFLPPIVAPGTVLGGIAPHTLRNLGVLGLEQVQVIAPATHDTGSAVAAIPAAAGTSYAYISSGTWSLMGVESPTPIVNDTALKFNMTNEGGIGRDGKSSAFRVLKNIMGLWLVQECRRKWQQDHADADGTSAYADLMALAQQAVPRRSFINPDADDFLHPTDMPAAIANFCRATHQSVPQDRGAILRCALESLALKYRYTLAQLEQLTGQHYDVIHIVGGGSQNTLLCQLAADCCARPVLAGPTEGTALGNILVQLIAQGALASLDEARAVERASFPLMAYTPNANDAVAWDEAYAKFLTLV